MNNVVGLHYDITELLGQFPLPSTILVLQSLDQEARKALTPLKLRAKAAKFAKTTVKAQMSSFKVTPNTHLTNSINFILF